MDPATWQPIDCHAHTVHSDGVLTVAELVEVVRARGVRPSVADHLSGDVRYAVKSIDGVEAYLDDLDEHDVARGGEFCWHDSLWRELPDELMARLTHRIGSLHAVILPRDAGIWYVFTRSLPDGLDADAYMNLHLENVERLTSEMPIDIFAHPTLIPGVLRARPADEVWTEAREERLVEALARSGVAFEVSSRYRPHERIVRRAHERGVRLALGSDGHAAEQVGRIEFSLALARAVGARDDELYDPLVHGVRTHSRTR